MVSHMDMDVMNAKVWFDIKCISSSTRSRSGTIYYIIETSFKLSQHMRLMHIFNCISPQLCEKGQ